jgi:AcrR family transcriptional regulator
VRFPGVKTEPSQESRTPDRRVLRSRSALFGAAVRLVSERGTTAIPITDLAEAADVSRRLVCLQFGDRESLLVEAAADLVRRELTPRPDRDTGAGAAFRAVPGVLPRDADRVVRVRDDQVPERAVRLAEQGGRARAVR